MKGLFLVGGVGIWKRRFVLYSWSYCHFFPLRNCRLHRSYWVGQQFSTDTVSVPLFITEEVFVLECSELSCPQAQQSDNSHIFPFPSPLSHTFFSYPSIFVIPPCENSLPASLWSYMFSSSLQWCMCTLVNFITQVSMSLMSSLSHFYLIHCLCLFQLLQLSSLDFSLCMCKKYSNKPTHFHTWTYHCWLHLFHFFSLWLDHLRLSKWQSLHTSLIIVPSGCGYVCLLWRGEEGRGRRGE